MFPSLGPYFGALNIRCRKNFPFLANRALLKGRKEYLLQEFFIKCAFTSRNDYQEKDTRSYSLEMEIFKLKVVQLDIMTTMIMTMTRTMMMMMVMRLILKIKTYNL